MKTDQLNLNQLLRYGFCGMFLFFAFIYGHGGLTVFEKHFVTIKDHAVLLTSSFFGAGALLYTLYRALIYPYLGRLAFWATFDLPDEKQKNVRWLKTKQPSLCSFILMGLLVVGVIVICLVILPSCWKWCVELESGNQSQCSNFIWGLVGALIVLAIMAILIYCCIRSFGKQSYFFLRYASVFSMPDKEMQSDRERWQSKLNEAGAQCLEEWASQIHMLYTTALALWSGSVAGAWWPSESVSIAFSKMSPSPLGCLFIAALFFAAFASDCRRRYMEKYLLENYLWKKICT